MSTLFWTIVLWVAGYSWNQLHGTNAQLVCQWVMTEKTNIQGGKYAPATDLAQCQQICISNGYCKSVDWDSANRCWLHNTTAGQKFADGVTHYDYICNVNPCNPNPCQNGGQCVEGGNQSLYTCTCINGWSGPTCGTPPNPCSSSPCKNGGQCSVGSTFDQFVCTCAYGFSGSTCEIPPPNPCSSSPCKNGGICSVGSTFDQFVCDCVNGYSGPTCDIAPPAPCSSSPCKNGGICRVGSSPDQFICDCVNGYSGPTCDIAPPDPCSSSPCKNGGICYIGSTNTEFTCDCVNGFTGPTCATPGIEPEQTTAAEPEEPDCTTREIVRRESAMPCVQTNYPGKNMDIYAKPDGFSWDYRLPRFEFNWPADISGRRITRMFYGSQTNLGLYGAIILYGYNKRFESKKVHGDLTFEIITQIRKVIVYFEPLNLEEPLTVTGFNIRHCTVTGVCEPREIFSRIKDVAVSYQGLVKNEPQIRADGLHWQTSMTLPYVIVNVTCLGYGAPEIRRIGITSIDVDYRTHVLVFKNNVRVPTINRLGQLTEYFNFHPPSATNVNSMRFQFKTVYGDRIRVTFIPPKDKIVGDKVHIWWKSFFVVICI